jgi:hypothetical protein
MLFSLGVYRKDLLIRVFVGSFMNCCKRESIHLQKQWHDGKWISSKECFISIQFSPVEKYCLSVTRTKQLILLREMVASDFELNM